MALPAGFPPASFRLEDGCLMYSTTAAIEIGQRGRTCTCDRSVPSRVCWLLHYALMAPAGRRSRAGELVSCGNGELRSLERSPSEDWRTRRELHPQPSRRQRGALLSELRVRNGLPSIAWNPIHEKSSFTQPMEDIL